MRYQRNLASCLFLLLFAAAGCAAPGGKTASSGIGSSTGESSLPASQVSASSTVSAAGVSSEQVFEAGAAGSKSSTGESPASAGQVSSESQIPSTLKASSKIEQNDSEWVAYSNSKDEYKLHIKRKDGTEDKVIGNNVALEPCVAGEWVYYIAPLDTINKVKLDGSQKTRACSTDALVVYNANANKYHGLNGSTSVTAEYKDGYILYTCFQMRQDGDKKINPTSYYKLDPNTDKITKVQEK